MSMMAPGVTVTSRATPPPRGVSVNSGTWFVVGEAQRGPVDKAELIRNLEDFKRLYGTRQTYSLLYDSLETYFREGGTRAVIGRVVGPDAEVATVTLDDAEEGASLVISAANPGAWGNLLNVAIEAGVNPGEYVVVVSDDALGTLERSVSLPNQASAVSWSQNSDYIRATLPVGGGELVPAVVPATSLAGGADDIEGVDDAGRVAALALFLRELGTGMVSVPGATSSTVRAGVKAHAEAHNREALLDATDTGTKSALVTEGKSLQGDEYGALAAPWLIVPGVVPGTTRTVPSTAAVAGLASRSDGLRSANVPAAGTNGQLRYVIGLKFPGWSESDRAELNEAGVNIFRTFPEGIQLYGYRTLANPAVDRSWLSLANQRFRLVLAEEFEQVAKAYVHTQLDPLKVAEFGGALRARLSKHYTDGSLYGATPAEAFTVDVGDSVNTPETLGNGELRAVVAVKMSPSGERVIVEMVKVAVGESL